jgi:hypothetical protein
VAETGWSTPESVAARLRPRWRSGDLLRRYASGAPFDPVDVPLRGPRASDLGADLDRVRRWIDRLERAAPGRYDLVRRAVGARTVGRNEVPSRAVVSEYDQAWRLLGVEDDVARYDRLLAATAGDPEVTGWLLERPSAALAVAEDEWPAVLAALGWLRDARGSGRYVREISAPGVDTKVVERHRPTLAALLGVPSAADRFAAALGLRDRPARLRVRWGPGVAGATAGLTDVTAPVEELATLDARVSAAVVVENEITFLTVPVPADGVVVFGEGFRVSRAGALPWLAHVPVHYWGDLDTHGFAILDRLRAWLPQTTSFLMDRETLLAHRDRWVGEPSPTSADLARLTAEERALYEDLVTDRYADRVRLEQERVDWAWVLDRWPVGRPS